MTVRSLRGRYVDDSITTASPPRLLVMLYDRLVLDLQRAEAAQVAGDRGTANEQLLHAQDIVLELRSSLDPTTWEGGQRLMALYVFLQTELVKANVTGDAARTGSCRAIVEPLRDAWRTAAASIEATGTPSGATHA